MFIRKAVKSLGAVYKLVSHGAAREGSAVGSFIARFLPTSFYTRDASFFQPARVLY